MMMKRFFSVLTCVFAAAVLVLSAQDKGKGWHEKMKSQKVAFITDEINLTAEEAQAFWPLYNQSESARFKAFGAVMAAQKALRQAIEQGKSGKEVEDLLSEYIECQKKASAVDAEFVEKYKAVIPVEKVAKLFIAEEKFRRQQINRLHHNGKKEAK